jgi:cell division protein FtsI/penicillin-binding protein 2
MNKFALSVPVYSLYGEPNRLADPEGTATKLSYILSVDRNELQRKLEGKKRFIWLARELSDEVCLAIKKLKIKGLGFKREDQRRYPNGMLAANLIGFAGIDEEGLEGIEYQYDSILSPVNGTKLVLKGPGGVEIPNGTVIVRPPEGGQNLVLTIDDVVQHLAEKELVKIVEQWNPKSCFIVVQQPYTGEILACATRPSYNLTNYGDFPHESYKNRAVTDIYEPGSVFKIVTAAAALEDKRIVPETTFHCPGFVKVYGITMGCTSKHGTITVSEAIEKSCNVVLAKVGNLLGPESLYFYIRKFGFGEKTGISLPGESIGLLRLPTKWSGISSSAISFGQEIGVTGIQMITAISTVANGGSLVKPQIVKKIMSYDMTKTIEETGIDFRRRVISEDVARSVKGMMEQVVVYGTGRRGSLDRYTAAGKTGTSQKLAKKETGLKVVSFAGFLPVEKPAVTIYVVVDEPHGDHVGGSTVAAPAFASLAGKLMLYLGVTPDKVAGADDPQHRYDHEETGVTTPPPDDPPSRDVPPSTQNLIQGRNSISEPSSLDPAGMVIEAALAPLPGSAGVNMGIDVYTTGSEHNEAPSGDIIGSVIDAQVQKTYLLGTEGRTPYRQDNR